jgi:HPt (histidine-containing phosphotransfer) domain-containing protein
MQGEAQRCRERGMDDYLSKPLRLNELAAMLHKWLPLVEPPAPAPAPTPAPALRVWNPDALGDLVGNNPALHSRLLRKFLLSAQAHVTALLGAAAAEPVDCQTIALQAHTLKSSARSVGAQALGELCQALETIARQTDAGAASVQLIGTLEEAWTAVAAKIETHLEHLAATQPAPP